MIMWSSLLLSFLFTAPVFGQQLTLGPGHNATSLTGTWSTGSGAVMTGSPNADPVKMTFQYPKNTGRSFSFLDTPQGSFFEQLEYRIASNASNPSCITAVLTWQHGNLQYLSNGSLLLQPFEGDGFQQVESFCSAVSNQINRYNQEILFSQWQIFAVPGSNTAFHLMLFEFDGTPVAPMNILANPPNMLPTQPIVSPLTSPTGTANAKRDIAARNSAARPLYMAGGVGAMTLLGAVLVLL